MIWSVSMLSIGRTTRARRMWRDGFSLATAPARRRSRPRRRRPRPSAGSPGRSGRPALPPLEVAVAGADRVLARRSSRRSSRCTSSSPASRHSAPASRKTPSRPSASACRLHLLRARHHQHPHARAPPCAPADAAAARRSDRRELVQLPMNTTSIAAERAACPARGPCSARACWRLGSPCGCGTRPPPASPMPGFVPQVIIGWISPAESSSSRQLQKTGFCRIRTSCPGNARCRKVPEDRFAGRGGGQINEGQGSKTMNKGSPDTLGHQSSRCYLLK